MSNNDFVSYDELDNLCSICYENEKKELNIECFHKNHFCETCFDKLKKKSNKCPLCQKDFTNDIKQDDIIEKLKSPKEKNKDWFDDPYESTSIKKTHLINIYRPIGVNTITSAFGTKNLDIKKDPQNPKYVVSPWLNEKIEPDTNLKNKDLCY